MKKFLTMLAFIALVSCNQNDTVVPQAIEKQVATSPVQALAVAPVYEFDKSVNLQYYKHWCEFDIPSNQATHPNARCIKNYGCSPASYMMARGIINQTWSNLVTANEYWILAQNMGTNCSGTSVDQPGFYAQRKDQFGSKHKGLETYAESNSGRDVTKTSIRAHLTDGRPILGFVKIKSALDPTLVTTEASGAGHTVIIVGLKQTSTGTGSLIKYIDPLAASTSSASTRIKEVDYTTFLNSMKALGAVYDSQKKTYSYSYYMQRIGL
jgi:hypothetical protein